jgi:hypothetical protein
LKKIALVDRFLEIRALVEAVVDGDGEVVQ